MLSTFNWVLICAKALLNIIIFSDFYVYLERDLLSNSTS